MNENQHLVFKVILAISSNIVGSRAHDDQARNFGDIVNDTIVNRYFRVVDLRWL